MDEKEYLKYIISVLTHNVFVSLLSQADETGAMAVNFSSITMFAMTTDLNTILNTYRNGIKMDEDLNNKMILNPISNPNEDSHRYRLLRIRMYKDIMNRLKEGMK